MDEIREDKQDISKDETPEKPSAETPETTPPVETKTYSEEELNKKINEILTAKGRDAKRLSEWETNLANQQKQLRETINTFEREKRQKELDALADDPDAQSKAKYKHRLEDELRQLEQQKEDEKGAVTRMFNQAKGLIKQHNLPPDVISELLDATSPREMELIAENMSYKVQPKVATPKEEKTGFKPDSGTSDAGADSDEAFLQRWNTGKEPATKENLARAKKIINK